MKSLLLLIFALINIAGATCDNPISRVNNSANAVLSSTKYNSDHNTAYTKINDLEGSCITDGTVTADKLDSSTLPALNDAISEGCKVEYSNSSTLSIDKCYLSIDGNQVETTSANTVTFGDNSGSSEVASTSYYVYALGTSTGSTLNLRISTTVPDDNGYNSTNRVLGRFYNNASSDIDQYSIDQWNKNDFIPNKAESINGGALDIKAVTTDPTKGTTTIDVLYFSRIGKYAKVQGQYYQTGVGTDGSGIYYIQLPNNFRIDDDTITISAVNGNNIVGNSFVQDVTGGSVYTGITRVYNNRSIALFFGNQTTSNNWSSSFFQLSGTNDVTLSFEAMVPIEGWNN